MCSADLAHESRKLNTDIAGLIRDIEAANRKRTQDSEKSPVAKYGMGFVGRIGDRIGCGG